MALSGKSNISPKIWGPYFWKTLHISTFGYPKVPNQTDKNTYENFYKTFMKILPCDKCSRDSQTILDDELIKALESRDDLINWGYNFHKAVNTKLGVPSIEFSQFKQDMQQLIDGNNTNLYIKIAVITLIIIICMYFMFMHYMPHNP
jgi:hypothetical protein